MKTLKDYIAFLEENHLTKEANFYSVEVVGVLSRLGIAAPLDMSTKEVISTLYKAHETLQAQWDGELTW